MTVGKIAIIGGGIGGLASGILLARQGYQVTIYEKAETAGPVGAGFLLQPPGQEVLQELGVLQDVCRQAVPIFGLQSMTLSGRKILDLDYRHLQGQPRHGLGIQRSTIYAALLKVVQGLDGVKIIWDNHVEKCTTDDKHISILVNKEVHIYDLCILSSGANSHLADGHFDGRVRRPYTWGCLWTTFKLPDGLSPNMLHQRCHGAKKMMGILPVSRLHDGYEAALYWSAKVQDLKGMDARQFSAIKDEMNRFWPEATLSLEPLQYINFIAATYNDIWTPKPFKGRLIAIGDISHATSPQLGQGCTMALLDAWSLAKAIQRNKPQLHDAVAQWWHARRYQLAYVRHLSRLLTPLYQSENKLNGVWRDWLMAPMGRVPWFYQLQLKTLASEVFLKPLK